MKTTMTVKEVFSNLKEKLNTHSFYRSHTEEYMVDEERGNVSYFLNKYAVGTLAQKLNESQKGFQNFTDKQIWVLAFELVKIEEYIQQQIKEEMELNGTTLDLEKEKQKEMEANKILKPILDLKKKGAFEKWIKTSKNPYTKQFYSKKYTQECVDAFLAEIGHKQEKTLHFCFDMTKGGFCGTVMA